MEAPPLLAIFPEAPSAAIAEEKQQDTEMDCMMTSPEAISRQEAAASASETYTGGEHSISPQTLEWPAAEAPGQQVLQEAPQDNASRTAVPPLSLTLTRLPEELPPALRTEFEVDVSVLGEGAYAAVRRLRHKRTGDMVALKVVEKYPLLIRNMLPQLQREVGIQGCLQHRHLLRLFSSVEDETHVYMVLEYCEGGSLRSLAALQPAQRFPEAQAAWLFTQILYGVDFMHQRGVVHRDLKHDNILLTAAGEVRICDFGWSAEVQIEKALLTTCGTPHMWAPEIFEGLPQGYGTDLWALGNLVYELLVGHQPFWGTTEELRWKVLSVDLRYPPDLLSQAAINLFYCLLQRDQRHRMPACRLIAEHPWVVPTVAELARFGLMPEPMPAAVVRQPSDLPMAHATFEHVSVDSPIAMRVDVEGPFSFVPPLQQQEPAATDTQEAQAPTLTSGGAPNPTIREGPARNAGAKPTNMEETRPFPCDGASDALVEVPAEAEVAGPAELLLNDEVALAINSDVQASEDADALLSKEADSVAEADTSGASSQQDSVLGGA